VGEFGSRHAGRAKGVDDIAVVGIAQGHAANQHFIFSCTDVREDDCGKAIPGSLRAGVQSPPPGGDHDVLQKRAVIQQGAPAHDPVQGEHQPHGRVKKSVVALVLLMHAVLVSARDAQQTIQAPAVFPAPVDIRADPLGRVVVIFLGVLARQRWIGTHRVVGGADLVRQGLSAAQTLSAKDCRLWPCKT